MPKVINERCQVYYLVSRFFLGEGEVRVRGNFGYASIDPSSDTKIAVYNSPGSLDHEIDTQNV